MAYSDSKLRFWEVDLTTRAGALGAAHMGGTVCLIMVGMVILGMIVFGAVQLPPDATTEEYAAGLGMIALEGAVFLIAGLRLRAGKGLWWGAAAAALLVLEIVAKIASLTGIGGLIINILMLVALINGMRGAFTLKREVGFEDDDIDTFA
jgi:uncharacterized membrane protein YhhN